MFKNLTIISLLGLLSVILGAFGAHALEDKLTVEALDSYETAVRYQMYHVIILLIINLYSGFSAKQKNIASYLFIIGILFFSGSIYCIQLTSITVKSIWFITPLGGLFLILGWGYLVALFLKKAKK